MIFSKSTCGLCKPTKRYKRNSAKLKNAIRRAMLEDDLTANLIKSYSKS